MPLGPGGFTSLFTYEVTGKTPEGSAIEIYTVAETPEEARDLVRERLGGKVRGRLTARRVSWNKAVETVSPTEYLHLLDMSSSSRLGIKTV